MERIRICELRDLQRGDIIILHHKIPVNAAVKEDDKTLRKYRVLQVCGDYALCESLNGYPHKECFSFCQLQEKKAKIYRQ